MILTRDSLLAAVVRRQQETESTVFGGALRYQELTRAEWRAAQDAAQSEPDSETGAAQIWLDVWNAYVFAAGVIGEDGTPWFTGADVAAWPNRDGLWAEVTRIAGLILTLSDQEPDAVKKK